MSSEWKTYTLADVAFNGKEGLIDGPFGSALPADLYQSDGMPVIRGSNLSKGEVRFKGDDFVFVSEEVASRLARATCIPEDIVFTKKGTLGQVGIIPTDRYPAYLLSSNQMRLRVNKEVVLPDFAYYYLSQKKSIEKIVRDSEHTGVPKINLAYLRSFPIVVPPISEQRHITTVLNILDDRIALLRETNATLESMAQALFKSWFVDFDPVHANAGTHAATLPAELQALFPSTFTDTPQGLVPEGWGVGTIADFADLNPESWTAKKHPETVAYIDLANAKDNVIADIAEFEFDGAPSRARRVLRDGDTIVGTVRPGNRSFAFIQDAASNLTGSTGFAVLRPKHPRNTAFVYLVATNGNSIDYLTHIADGGAYPAVRPEVVANLSCVCPPLEVLEAFNSVAAELLTKITKNHQQTQTLATLRDTLLPRLISGQLRLPDAEAVLMETDV